MRPLNAAAYAFLGLIAAREGSTYELAQRMKKNYRFFWPRAQSNFYASIKLLVKHQLATATDEGKGQRPRTVYRATALGIEQLSVWLAKPAQPPSFEFEGLLRVAYADFGDKRQLLERLETIRDDAEMALAAGAGIARDYAHREVELPGRAHTGHLLWQFLCMQHDAIADWPDTKPSPAALEQAERFFARAAASRRRPVALRNPRRTGAGRQSRA